LQDENMAKQLRLIEMAAERRLTLAKDRKAPVVWLRQIRVLREMQPGDDYVARRIDLRRGMNILWAKASQGGPQSQLFNDSISGHSAGKTTFCRLLRYVLGEPHFGDELLRREIRGAFSHGWAVAEVVVDGTDWVVCRPFGVGAHPFVCRDASIENIFDAGISKDDFNVYRDALNEAVLSNVPVRRLTAGDELLHWDHLLPWIARDQDCHFDSLIDWRDPSSDSGSPQLDSTDRHLLLRGMLGLIADEESQERQANERRIARRKVVRARRPTLIHQANVDKDRLQSAFGRELPPINDGLFHDAVNREIETYATKVVPPDNEGGLPGSTEDLAHLESALDRAMQFEAEARAGLKDAEDRLAGQDAILKSLRGDISESNRRELLDQLGPSSGFCNVPIDMAVEAGCPLASARPINFMEKLAERTLDQQLSDQEQLLGKLKAVAVQKKGVADSCQAATTAARQALAKARTERESKIRRIAQAEARVQHLRDLAENAESAWREAEQAASEEERLDRQISRSYEKQNEIREQIEKEMRDFSALFDYFICALLGQSVEGKAAFSGRDIDLMVYYRGERRSAAIKIVKNIAFDLAALTSSMEGRGFHPRMLVHDGPRESDMSADLYRKIFMLVRILEGHVLDGEPPNFQYIITTTEPPPSDLQTFPWLLQPVLDASDPAKRFLGVDL
jgi:predicted secreted protein